MISWLYLHYALSISLYTAKIQAWGQEMAHSPTTSRTLRSVPGFTMYHEDGQLSIPIRGFAGAFLKIIVNALLLYSIGLSRPCAIRPFGCGSHHVLDYWLSPNEKKKTKTCVCIYMYVSLQRRVPRSQCTLNLIVIALTTLSYLPQQVWDIASPR